MKPNLIRSYLRAICLSLPLVAISLTSCDSGAGPTGGSIGNANGDSVGDVAVPGNGSSGGVLPGDMALSARVRNESSTGVDVTMRFIREDEVIHLAFVRVPTATITTVSSPEMVDMVELSGVDDLGSALDRASFEYGRDFDEDRPAEYLVRDRGGPGPVGPGDDGDDPTELAFSLREPARDLTVVLGAMTLARWTDEAGEGALIRLYLRPLGGVSNSALIAVGPSIGASLDGLNDELAILLEGVTPGRYQVVGELTDGDGGKVQATAPGVLNLVTDPVNIAPTITIRSPLSMVDVEQGASVAVSWSDTDPNHNAIINFTLERRDSATAATVFLAGPPIAENPDGPTGDSTGLSLSGVLPGIYDLVATISDGSLSGTARVPRVVRVLPSAQNTAPQLVLRKPSADVTLAAGGALLVGWDDSDDNDDAQISILLDSQWNRVGLSGGELVLAASVGEDGDGSGDEMVVRIPSNAPAGKYRVIGVITDGMTQVVTRAPGFVHVLDEPDVVIVPEPGGDSGGDAGGGDDPRVDDPGDDDGSGDDGGPGDDGDDEPPADDGGGSAGDDPGTGGDGSGGDQGGGDGDGGDPGNGGDDSPPDDGGTNDPPPTVPANPRVVEPLTYVTAWTAELPDGPPARLLATNVPYGGSTTIELPLSAWRPSDGNDLAHVDVPVELVPNDSWPRSFDLVVEFSIQGRIEVRRSDAPVWIPQLVEVLTIGTLNHACSRGMPTYLSSHFSGVEVVWYGGGVHEGDTGTTVEFWLSRDSTVPEYGVEDESHRLMWRSTGSPNAQQTTRVAMQTVLLGRATVIAGGGSEEGEASHLTPGLYQVMVVADYGRAGQVITRPVMDPIQICDQTLGASD